LPNGLYGTRPIRVPQVGITSSSGRSTTSECSFWRAVTGWIAWAGECLYACSESPKCLDLTGFNQFLHRAGDTSIGTFGPTRCLDSKIDDIGFESLQRALGGLLECCSATVQTCRSRPIIAATEVEPEFGGDQPLCSRKGARASPTSSSFKKRAIDFGRSKCYGWKISLRGCVRPLESYQC